MNRRAYGLDQTSEWIAVLALPSAMRGDNRIDELIAINLPPSALAGSTGASVRILLAEEQGSPAGSATSVVPVTDVGRYWRMVVELMLDYGPEPVSELVGRLVEIAHARALPVAGDVQGVRMDDLRTAFAQRAWPPNDLEPPSRAH